MSSLSSGSSGSGGSASGGGGTSWPPALRRRLGIPPSSAAVTKSIATKSYETNNDDSDNNEMPLQSSSLISTTASSSTNSHQQLSSHELRKYIHSSYHALTSLQRQLHRGEESYFEQSYARGNILMGWDNIWMEQQSSSSSSSHAHNINNSNSSGHGGGGELDAASSNDVNNHHPSNNSNKHHHQTAAAKSTITIRKMPNDYRWFTASCCTNLPITTTDNNNSNIVGGRIMALERNSLIDRCPTPEVQEQNVEIVVDQEGGGQGGDDFNDDVKKEEKDISVANELSSELSMEGKNEGEVVDKSEKGGEDVESAADMEIDESTVLASNNVKNEGSDTAQQQQSMEIDSSNEPEHRDAFLKKAKANEPNEQPLNVPAAAAQHSSTLPNDNVSSDSMVPSMAEDEKANSAASLSNKKEPSLPPTLSVAIPQTNETKIAAELPASNTSNNGGLDYVQWPSDMAIPSPAADAEANQMGKDDGGVKLVQSKQQVETEAASNNDDVNGTASTNVDHSNSNAEERVLEKAVDEPSGKNTANQKEAPAAIGDKDESSNALVTAAVDQPHPPYSSKRARHQTKDDDYIGNDSIDEEQTEDSDDEKPISKSDSAAASTMVSSLNETTMDEKSSNVVDHGSGNNDAGKSNNTQSKQQLNKEEKVAVSTGAATTESASRTTSRRSTRKRKAAS